MINWDGLVITYSKFIVHRNSIRAWQKSPQLKIEKIIIINHQLTIISVGVELQVLEECQYEHKIVERAGELPFPKVFVSRCAVTV